MRITNKTSTVLDVTAIIVIAYAISVVFYHPFYFGDELTAFFWSGDSRTFFNIYDGLNSYKPRLIFNALWALYGDFVLPRYVPMIVNGACLSGSASMLYLIVRKHFCATRPLSFAVAMLVVTSRFGTMLYFDYLSGNIETLSLFLFACSLFVLLSVINESRATLVRLSCLVVLSCAVVLVHERYIAATAAMGVVLVIAALPAKEHRALRLTFGAAVLVLPPLIFYSAGILYSSLPITTGTAGRETMLNLDTVKGAIVYGCNLLLGTNFGFPWFVGALNVKTPPGAYIIPVLAVISTCLWTTACFKAWRHRVNVDWITVLLMVALIAAMIGVAALPGPAKQESRWMFPLSGIVGLLAIALGRKRFAALLVTLFLVTNLVYFAAGSYKEIFNVQSSSTAKRAAEAFVALGKSRGPGIITEAPEPQTSWWLGGDTVLGNTASSGIVFCRINFDINSACLYPPTAIGSDVTFGFGLKFVRGQTPDTPTFEYVSGRSLAEMLRVRRAGISHMTIFGTRTLRVSPSEIEVCGRSQEASDVSVQWDISDPATNAVVVWLVSPDGSVHLFAKGGRRGSAQTGDWVRSRLTFVLTDARTGKVIAASAVRARLCPSG